MGIDGQNVRKKEWKLPNALYAIVPRRKNHIKFPPVLF
jgi:hypothetical protein